MVADDHGVVIAGVGSVIELSFSSSEVLATAPTRLTIAGNTVVPQCENMSCTATWIVSHETYAAAYTQDYSVGQQHDVGELYYTLISNSEGSIVISVAGYADLGGNQAAGAMDYIAHPMTGHAFLPGSLVPWILGGDGPVVPFYSRPIMQVNGHSTNGLYVDVDRPVVTAVQISADQEPAAHGATVQLSVTFSELLNLNGTAGQLGAPVEVTIGQMQTLGTCTNVYSAPGDSTHPLASFSSEYRMYQTGITECVFSREVMAEDMEVYGGIGCLPFQVLSFVDRGGNSNFMATGPDQDTGCVVVGPLGAYQADGSLSGSRE